MSNRDGPRRFMDNKNTDQGNSGAKMRWTIRFREECCGLGGSGPRMQGPVGKGPHKSGPGGRRSMQAQT